MASSKEKPIHADNILPFKERTERDSLLGPRPSAPADTCRLAYCIFFLHGVGHLLPWNFFITAQLVRTAAVLLYTLVMSHLTLPPQYFQAKFTCPHGNNTACYGFNSTFENWFSVASMVPIFVMSAANVWLQSR